MGQWMEKYGQTIYATRGGPFRTTPALASTYTGNTIYVHVLDWKTDTLRLPPLPRKILSSSLLTGGAAEVTQTDSELRITVAPKHRQDIDTIIQLNLDGPAAGIAVLAPRSNSLAAGKQATASNVYARSPDNAPAKAFDDDPSTRWATDAGTHQAWLEVDLGQPTSIASVFIDEAYPGRVRKFELQYKTGAEWKTLLSGTRLGAGFSKSFTPVTAQHVRLNILDASEGPTINEFQLFPPSK
jgi:alpha-L-fucosidase